MYAKYIKRILDFVLSLMALIVLSPLLAILIILGAVFMRGNPFFTQARPGKNEKIFKLIKFRTMDNRKDKDGKLLPDDVRLNKDERNFKHTKPPKNYTHLYEGFGNHICIRKDYYPVVEPIIRDLIEKNELVNWYKRTEKIINAIKNLTAEKKKGNIKCD